MKNNEIFNNYIPEQKWKKASRNFPLEFHLELIKHAYDIQNMKAFEDLSRTATIRCKYRRHEVPYINDIKLGVSFHPHPNGITNYLLLLL